MNDLATQDAAKIRREMSLKLIHLAHGKEETSKASDKTGCRKKLSDVSIINYCFYDKKKIEKLRTNINCDDCLTALERQYNLHSNN